MRYVLFVLCIVSSGCQSASHMRAGASESKQVFQCLGVLSKVVDLDGAKMTYTMRPRSTVEVTVVVRGETFTCQTQMSSGVLTCRINGAIPLKGDERKEAAMMNEAMEAFADHFQRDGLRIDADFSLAISDDMSYPGAARRVVSLFMKGRSREAGDHASFKYDQISGQIRIVGGK